MIIHVTTILLSLSFPSSPPPTMFLYAVVSPANWNSGSSSKLEILILHHYIMGGREPWGHLHDFTWVLGPRTSWKDVQWRSKQKRALLPQKHWKTTLHFKKVERWEMMLFKLGICPIEIFNTEAQKLKYSKPAPIQKSESPWWDYHSRNSMFIGS